MAAPTRRLSVLIENPMLPPYRLALFRALARSPYLDASFAYGKARTGSALHDVDASNELCVLPVRNVYLGAGAVTLQFGLLRHLKMKRWDAMIASFDPRLAFNLLALHQARRSGTKFIWWGHGIRPRMRFVRLYSFLARTADAVILYSQDGKDRLIDTGVPANKIFVAWNSIDTAQAAALAMCTPFSDRKRLLYIGRLTSEKKVDLLIRSFIASSPQLPSDLSLTIIGDGPDSDRLREIVRQEGAQEKVEFLGAIYDQAALAPYFNQSLLSVSPGPMGLSGIQSMAFGVPMLVADNEPHGPEIALIERGVTGMFFRAGDFRDLARGLEFLCNNRELLQLYSESCHEVVRERLGVSAMVEEFVSAVHFACNKTM